MNLASLQSQLHEMREQVAHLQEALERSHRENKILRQKLDALARRFFGKKSEQLNAAQLELLLSGLGEESVDPNEEEEPPPPRERQRSCNNPRRIRTPENLEVVRELIEPNALLMELLKLAESDARLHDIELAVELAENMPPLYVDPIQIQQVALNLIRNAIDAMNEIGCRNGQQRIGFAR